MLKKALLVFFLAIQFVTVANVSTNHLNPEVQRVPLPGCFPCPD